MKKRMLSVLGLMVFALLGATWGMSQDTGTQTETPAAKAPAMKKMAKPARAAAMQSETLSGTITMVDAAKKLVVVTDSGGVPFNFVVNGATRIKVGDKKGKLADLSSDTTKQASVTFVAMKKRGNIAKSIEVTE
ncbi:MAG TPA: hypothetical protein VGW33_08840 [Terriglobia bacterium]|nr:hypothetical protein [Terriglobia bacterium]